MEHPLSLTLPPEGGIRSRRRRQEFEVGLRDSHVPYTMPAAIQLVEANVLLLDGGVQPNRHDHEAKRQRAGPDCGGHLSILATCGPPKKVVAHSPDPCYGPVSAYR